MQTLEAYKPANKYILLYIKCTLFLWWICTNKTLPASNFHWYVFTFHLVQSVNIEFMLMKTIESWANRENKQMCVIVKTRCFYRLAINLQSNLKKFSTLFLRQYGGLFKLKTLEVFTTTFLLDNYYLNLIFFQALRSALLKNEKKIFSKISKSHKNCLA